MGVLSIVHECSEVWKQLQWWACCSGKLTLADSVAMPRAILLTSKTGLMRIIFMPRPTWPERVVVVVVVVRMALPELAQGQQGSLCLGIGNVAPVE